MSELVKQIVLGVSGSIAAYRSAELVGLLRERELDVHVIMTESAGEFVTELTFRTLSRNPVATHMFSERQGWVPTHIQLADQADILVIAPCTANIIAKLANGLADDTLSATALATKAPLVIAPAMNGHMWEHPATQANVAILLERGVEFVEVERGDLACGYEGLGRMAEPERIVETVWRHVGVSE